MANNLLGAYYILVGKQPKKIKSLCLKYNISRIRISEPNINIFHAFIGTGISLSFDVPNHWLGNIAINNFFHEYLEPFINRVNFNYIIVGKDMDENILPTMNRLRDILNANSLGAIKLTTHWSYDETLLSKDPPSVGAFDDTATGYFQGIINFLKQQGSPLMINVYPYHKYINDSNISLGYAIFGAANPVRDGRLFYNNLFDAMVDTFYAAIDKLGVGNVDLVVGETGWPTSGQGDKSTVVLAATYNQNFKAHISSGRGTPRRPNVFIEGFIRGLFNDDGGAYGVFGPDFKPVYPLFD